MSRVSKRKVAKKDIFIVTFERKANKSFGAGV